MESELLLLLGTEQIIGTIENLRAVVGKELFPKRTTKAK
jgi:hypothetical protein